MIYFTFTESNHYTIACHMGQETEMKPLFGQLMRLCLKTAQVKGLSITRYDTAPMLTKNGEELRVVYNMHGSDLSLFRRILDQLEQQPGIEPLAGHLVNGSL